MATPCAQIRTLSESASGVSSPLSLARIPIKGWKKSPPTARMAMLAKPNAALVYSRGTVDATTTKVRAYDPLAIPQKNIPTAKIA